MKNNLSLFLFIALFIFSCTDKSNNESIFFDKNTYRNSENLRTDNQITIDWLTNKEYGFSELIEYNNGGEYEKYVFIKLNTKYILCVTSSCTSIDTFQYNGYEIIDEGILEKGKGKIELYTIKSDTAGEYLFKNIKNVGLNISTRKVYKSLSMDSTLIYEGDEIISDSQKKKVKEYIKKKDFESLSTFFVDSPIFILKFLKKGKKIDESGLLNLVKYPRIIMNSEISDTSKILYNEYYDYVEKKYK